MRDIFFSECMSETLAKRLGTRRRLKNLNISTNYRYGAE